MKSFLVVDHPDDWPLESAGAEVVPAQKYLTDPAYIQERSAKVFNLCRSYNYQSIGYYVSLLSAARGHKPLPSVSTIVDFRLVSIVRIASEELSDLINKSLAPLHSQAFLLSIYFGKNVARRYEKLSARLFRLFPAPLIRCSFAKDPSEGWRLKSIRLIAMSDVPEDHREMVVEAAREFFEKRRVPTSAANPSASRFSLAILQNPGEAEAPSDSKTIQKFIKVADKMGIGAEVISEHDYGRLAEFDALFIRETTNVNHHTFRFARRAQAEGLVVIDDPDSILRCSNKVYLAELLFRAKVPTPRTIVVHGGNVDGVGKELDYPSILKQPDSAFSRGVRKVNNREEFLELARELLTKSELIIAQEFMPTEFDWRVGVLNGEPLFVCRYHMARKHWQIVRRDEKGNSQWGRTETVPLWQAPALVVKTALQAANLIGSSLYGVDLKESRGSCYVVEVNDNPDILAGTEDADLKEELYQRVLTVFYRRVEERRGGRALL